MEDIKTKLAKASSSFFIPQSSYQSDFRGSSVSVDKLSFEDHDTYAKVITDCRFYFRHEPLASTVVRKMVDIAINDLIIPHDNLTKTEIQIYTALKTDLIKFIRKAALEYLITGLVVPEVTLTRLSRPMLRDKGIQRLDSLMYPTTMWIRDSKDIEIKRPFITDDESYFLIIPQEVINFINSGGVYDDGSEDKELYNTIIKMYPEFVAQVKRGETKVLLDNPLIIKSTVMADSQYPIPYLYSSIEAFKHKRNMRRMDYSIVARVISAILHVRVGNDSFPLTEDQEDFLTDLESKFKWRESITSNDIERVFTLFTNHTVELEWIFPSMDVLTDDKKYEAVNRDITIALGFPRILITGETEKSFTSDPEIATLSPVDTMETMRDDLFVIIQKVFTEVISINNLTTMPDIKFKPINLMSLRLFYEGLTKLYDSGNLSRKSFAEAYGYDIAEELNEREKEATMIKEKGLDDFAPVPHSNAPTPKGKETKKGAPFGNKNGQEA